MMTFVVWNKEGRDPPEVHKFAVHVGGLCVGPAILGNPL